MTTTLSAKPQLAEELKHQLEVLHGRDIPTPTSLTYKRWADPFFGAGWHTWNPGSKPLEASKTLVAPLKDEAYSTAQGWIEGALKSSEEVLAHMGAATKP